MKRIQRVASMVSAIALSTASLLAVGGSSLAKTVNNLHKSAAATQKTTNLSWFTDVSWWSVPGWKANTKAPVYSTFTHKFGLTVTTDVPPTNGDAKLSLMLTTGNIPNVITLENSTEAAQLVKSGRVWNLTQFFKKYDPQFLKAAYPVGLGKGQIAEQSQVFGGFYGMPNYDSAPDMFVGKEAAEKIQVLDGTNAQIIFNVPLMKKAGITVADVRTAAGLERALAKVAAMHLKVKGQPVVPLLPDKSSEWTWGTLNSLAQMFGAMPVTKQGNYRPLRLSPEMVTTIDYLHTLASKGLLTPSEFTLDNTANDAVVNAGRAFAFLGNTGNPSWADMWKSNHQETVASPGNVLSPNKLTPTWGFSYNTDWTYTFISKAAPDPSAIAHWLAYMWSPQGQLLMNYGAKGPDWHFNSAGRVVQTAKELHQASVNSNYWVQTGIGAIWFFTDYPYILTIEPQANVMPTSMVNHMKLYRATTPPIHLYNATALTMPATLIPPGSTLANDQTQINTYWQEQVLQMIFSSGNTVSVNKMYRQVAAKMTSMGLGTIDRIINKQFHKQERQDHYTLKGINP